MRPAWAVTVTGTGTGTVGRGPWAVTVTVTVDYSLGRWAERPQALTTSLATSSMAR